MGKGKGATVSVQNLGWEDLAEAAEKAGKPSVVVDLIRDNELDAATALLLEEADIDEVAPKRLDKLKLVSALGHLRARADEILDDSFRDRSRIYQEPPELAAVTADAPRLDGEKVARDRRTVGEGRFGTVVSAATWQRSRREEMRVALKRPKARGDADARARVAPADLFALRELPNPNVVELHGVASVDGELNVVMELAKKSLAAGIRDDDLGGNRLDAVNCVAISPDGRRVVSCDGDNLTGNPGVLKVWDVATGRCVATLKGHSRPVNCVAISPDGRRVVSGSADKTLKVWDVETGECVATLEGHSSSVVGVAVFPDGQRVVSVSSDKTLKVWDIETGECVATLKGHSNWVQGVAVFPDGRHVVSGGGWQDNMVKVWDIETGECVATLEGHSSSVYCVAVFPDGRRVVSASQDKTLKLYGC